MARERGGIISDRTIHQMGWMSSGRATVALTRKWPSIGKVAHQLVVLLAAESRKYAGCIFFMFGEFCAWLSQL